MRRSPSCPGRAGVAGRRPVERRRRRRGGRRLVQLLRLMTLDERQAHMEKMWNAKTVEERNKIRDEHRKLMLERAKQQQQTVDEKLDDTVTLPQR